MLAKALKEQLNEDLILQVLESIGCHHIKRSKDYITAALPDGDNVKSIVVYIDSNHFNTEVFTRPEFQAKPIRDIITLVEFINKCTFPQAMKQICDITGIEYYHSSKQSSKPSFLEWLDFVETGADKRKDIPLTPIPETTLKQFVQCPVAHWVNEGITIHSQRKFEIGMDVASERITIPIRDELGTLVGVKGRSLNKDVDDKYIYLYNVPKSHLLYGEHRNYKHIKSKNEVIVVEAEKSVMKLHALGYKNAVALSGMYLSERQCQNILRLNVPVVIALDKGVPDSSVNDIIKSLQYPIASNKISVISDKFDLLDDKESPCDNSETWEVLYNNCQSVI